MPDHRMIAKALLAAFPTIESFREFKEDDREISRRATPCVIKSAFCHGVIDSNSEAAFVAFLKKHPRTEHGKLPAGLTFTDVLGKMAGNLSVNALIVQLEITARELSLPEIQAPMITRLKKRFTVNTPKKRTLLRIMAFKLAQKFPDLGWDYDLLLQLPESPENSVGGPRETAGITIAFHLQGQGESIAPADALWLKKELTSSIEYLELEKHVSKKAVETISATTFSLRTPKKPGALDEPRLYNEAMRNVMAIAHQMSARWLLSSNSSSQKKLLIIVHSGLFADAKAVVLRILEIRLTAESGIYLTDFSHLCALHASIKADFERLAPDPRRAADLSGDLWSVNNFLSYGYYDYIPCLLDEKMLPRSIHESSYGDFKRALHFPEHAGPKSFGAIAAMQRFPQNAPLLIEIAKVLCARQMPFEADTVLASLLLSNPLNLTARLMRMLIYLNIAHDQSDFLSAKLAFERAEAEGDFIVSSCKPESDIWHEIGVLHFGRAIHYLKYLRGKNAPDRTRMREADLAAELGKAREAFLKSMTVSATGKALNSLYMFGYTLCLIELLPMEGRPAGRNKNPATKPDTGDVFRSISTRVFRNIGWLRDEPRENENKLERTFQNLLLTLNLVIARYENLVLCRSNIPHMKYMFALILWDFAPAVTPQICRMTLEWLKIARRETGKLISDNISVYHVACGSLSAPEFMQHIQDTMDVIYQYVTDDELKPGKDSPRLRSKLKNLSRIKFMLLELERACADRTTKASAAATLPS